MTSTQVCAKEVAMAILMAYDKTHTVEDGLAMAIRVLSDSLFPPEVEPEWWEPVRGYQRRESIRNCLHVIACELENS